MRRFALLAALAALAPVALAQDEGKKPEEPKTPAPAPPQVPFGLKDTDLDELGKYADLLLAAEIGDGLVGVLILDEARARRPARRPGAEAGAGEGETDRPRAAAFRRPEPLTPFVTKKLDEGMKGEALATAIKAEREKRMAEIAARAGAEGEAGAEAGRGAGGFMARAQERAGEVVAKLRKEDKKGRAFVEGLLKELDMRGGRGGQRPERPPR
jgi:hypothetical protein